MVCMTQYISTRGGISPQSFETVLLSGMAPDGGLFVPETWPRLDPVLTAKLAGQSYADIAYHIVREFAGDVLPAADLRAIVDETYTGKVFDHKDVAPLRQLDANTWLLELFHGPTLSFKDYALQLVGRLFDRVLAKNGRRITIVGATSGDTGSAAIEACKGCNNIDIFILHPQGRTSEVQRRQMTSVDAPNVFNIALDGTFDDCQAMVKAMFADAPLRDQLNLSAVNSINWGRIMGQMVYYMTAALALDGVKHPVAFTVPTGNFGNVFAAWSARHMGQPIENHTNATNRNDILTRFFETGEMKLEGVEPSLSPSMDIQVSSNFERYLFELLDRDSDHLNRLMKQFKETGAFRIDPALHKAARAEFNAARCSDDDTLATMKQCYAETGILIDPHTAVALHAAKAQRSAVPMVIVSTAHPAKFPEAVQKATGITPPVPPRLQVVMKKAEHLMGLPNDYAKVTAFILANAKL